MQGGGEGGQWEEWGQGNNQWQGTGLGDVGRSCSPHCLEVVRRQLQGGALQLRKVVPHKRQEPPSTRRHVQQLSVLQRPALHEVGHVGQRLAGGSSRTRKRNEIGSLPYLKGDMQLRRGGRYAEEDIRRRICRGGCAEDIQRRQRRRAKQEEEEEEESKCRSSASSQYSTLAWRRMVSAHPRNSVSTWKSYSRADSADIHPSD